MKHPVLARVADLFIVSCFSFVLLVVPQIIEKVV